MKANSFSEAKLDRYEIEKRLREELKRLDLDRIARKVRTEVGEVAKVKWINPHIQPCDCALANAQGLIAAPGPRFRTQTHIYQ